MSSQSVCQLETSQPRAPSGGNPGSETVPAPVRPLTSVQCPPHTTAPHDGHSTPSGFLAVSGECQPELSGITQTLALWGTRWTTLGTGLATHLSPELSPPDGALGSVCPSFCPSLAEPPVPTAASSPHQPSSTDSLVRMWL